MKCVLSLAIMVVAGACAHPVITRPETASALPAAPVAASFDRTWDATISWFSDHNIPIGTIEKASGVMTATLKDVLPANRTSSGTVKKETQSKPIFADCGARDGVGYDPTDVVYSVRVTGDATKAAVQANAKYTQNGAGVGNSFFVCSSTGQWERELLTFIKGKAEK